ncbi:MAG: alpha-amylase family glycosyl hydrolase, partial [Bacillota bacterium]|nr:alpha-amylase family glycosyl hydrolase [Bacillota bacterium]
MSIKKLSEINLDEIIKDKKYFKSPVAWEDQVFYFLLVDRFSDGNEIGYINIEGNAVNTGKTPLYNSVDYENAVSNEIEAKAWRDSGDKWVGGNLRGIISKIGYLKRLGITAIWLSPVFKQVAYKETYHGYGIQNFLEIDPHFGSKEDLKELVKVSHDNGIYVIMDIILNHTGDVFCYAPDQNTNHDKNSTNISHPIWSGQKHPVAGFYKADGKGILPFEKINCDDSDGSFPNDDAIWPQEFQDPSYYTCKGHITYWDNNPEYT